MNERSPLRRWQPPLYDASLAAVLGVAAMVETVGIAATRSWAVVGAVVGMVAPLAWRQHAPLAVAAVVFGSHAVFTFGFGVPLADLVFIIPVFILALYSLGAHAPISRSLVGLGVGLAFITISVFANEGPGAEQMFFAVTMVAAPWLAGRLVRMRTNEAVRHALRAQQLEREQAEREQAAVAQERARIAREMHDIIAHSVSVMTVQAGAIEEVIDQDPRQARAAATSIRWTGRQALVDLRGLLGLLRDCGQSAEVLSPQPGLADLEDLLERVRSAGVDVRLEVEGTPRPLPPGVDLSAFRVVQEALTNTMKHAHARSARVGVEYRSEHVAIEVVDDGTAAPGDGLGHGLVGMRERIAMYGGSLEYGRQSAGGFCVRALLPVADRS